MASASTTQIAGTSPYVSLTITEHSRTDTTIRLSYVLKYHAAYAANTSVNKSYSIVIDGTTVASGSYDIDGRTGTHNIHAGTATINRGTSDKSITCSASFSFNLTWSGTAMGVRSCSLSYTIPKKTSYSVKYNANGGSGAPSSQTKWYGSTLTLSSTKPTRSGYTFAGWGISASDTSVDYDPGDSYTANKSITLYAIWTSHTYAVKYDANGGSGAPSAQTKYHGTTLKLSSAIPTRESYTFIGWGKSASATTRAFNPGDNYTANAAITLYAIWELNYVKPRITNFSVARCNSAGTASDEGTYARVKFSWACDRNISSIVIQWTDSSGATGSATLYPSGTSGSVNEIVGGSLNVEKLYVIEIFVHDILSYSPASINLPGAKFVMDFRAGGNGVAFGKAAERDGWADFGFHAVFNGSVRGNVFGLGTSDQILSNEDFNAYLTPGVYGVGSHAIAGTLKNNPAGAQAGRLIVCAATGGGYGVGDWTYMQQWYIPMTFTASGQNAFYVRTITREPNKAPNYYSWLKFTGTSA